MSEENKAQTPATPPTPPTDQPKLYAGKYKSVDDLETGIRNIAGFAADKIIIGDNGLVKSPDEAERMYKALTAARTAMSAAKGGAGTEAGAGAHTETIKAPAAPASPGSAPAAESLSLIPAPADLDSMDFDSLLKHSGIDAESVTKSWKETGKLGDDAYAALKKVGVPRAVADRLMTLEMQAAVTGIESVKINKAKGIEVAGGEDQLNAYVKWASEGGMDKDVLASLDAAVKKNPSKYPEVVKTIKAAFISAKGGDLSAPNKAGVGVPAGTEEIKSFGDMGKALADIRQGTPEQKAAALERIKRSNFGFSNI